MSQFKSMDVRRQRSLHDSHLQQSPFALLGATTRDDRRRIVELAEEKSLELDHDACQRARSDLSSLRTRLSAEMAWLPGVSPSKASHLVSALQFDPMSMREEPGLPTLAHLNLLASAFEAIDANDSPNDVAEFIQEMAYLANDLSAEQVLFEVNDDRSVSGFPEVKGIDQVEAELSDRKRYYRNTIKDALNRLPPVSLVEAMTIAVEGSTNAGEDPSPELVDELVDSYAVETQSFLQQEGETAQKLIKAARDSAKSGESVVKPVVDKLEAVSRNWDKVAQPIQLSAKVRGLDHEPSREIAYSIRGLAIYLFNEHDMLEQSQRLTKLLQELFVELPEVSEQVEQDANTLEDIFDARIDSEAQRDQWSRDITYSATVGLIFKDTLSISPEGLAWKNRHYALGSVTRVRWGGVRKSVNGAPAGITFTLAFGDSQSEAVIELKKESIYSAFVEKLWRAVGVRLLTELLNSLKSGNEVRFGDATLRDDSITLVKHRFLMPNEAIRCPWGQVHVWTSDGAFYIGSKNDKKTFVALSYINSPNAHILEHAIRIALKKPGTQRLSNALQ